jgi:GT2 family glycosyltransferase
MSRMDIAWLEGEAFNRDTISIAVTTYGTQSYYTQRCLEAIRSWKERRHEVLVACHDPSLLLEFYLKGCVKDGLIDQLIPTPTGYGHTQGVNCCFASARGHRLFNVANDIELGPVILDDCAQRLASDPQLGLIGWHWYNDGTVWEGDRLARYQLCDPQRPDMEPPEEQNVRSAPWFTGRTFNALGGPKRLCLCNTAFFGIRRDVWQTVGGFSGPYRHYWADDYLGYAVLDQGLNVEAFPGKYRHDAYFHEIQYSNVDVEDRRRNLDAIALPDRLEHYLDFLGGGLQADERQLLYQIARSLPDGATMMHVGLWRGTGLILCMAALKHATFIGIDCFEMPDVAMQSAQPPVCREEVIEYLQPFLSPGHTVQLIKANTLTMASFPRADVIFIDAGHTEACIENDVRLAKAAIKPGGLLIFHDYGQPAWPAVKSAIDAAFEPQQLRVHNTLCVVQA